MAELNILTASFQGKVGTTYGVKQYGKAIIKAIPFSHTPHNTKQKNALTAFIQLNRVSANIAKVFFQYLNLSDKKMYKSNAVSQWLKECLIDNQFVIDNMKLVIPQDGSLQITENLYNVETRTFKITIKNTPESENLSEEKIYVGIITGGNILKMQQVRTGVNIVIQGQFSTVDFNSYRVFCFKSTLINGKRHVKGFAISQETELVIENGIFYVNRWHWATLPYISNGILYLPDGSAEVINGVLTLL